LSCALCETRKERRFCPAVHGKICPQCCGEQREVTLDCPSECPYLQQSREHEKPRAMTASGEDLYLAVDVSEQFLYEREHLLMGLSFALAKAARADRSLNDRDLIAALHAMCASQQRLVGSGLHYADAPAGTAQAAVIVQVEEMLKQYEAVEREHAGHSTLTNSDTLKVLVFMLRMAHSRTSGRPRSRALIDFLLAQFPEQEKSIVSPAEASGGIVIP